MSLWPKHKFIQILLEYEDVIDTYGDAPQDYYRTCAFCGKVVRLDKTADHRKGCKE